MEKEPKYSDQYGPGDEQKLEKEIIEESEKEEKLRPYLYDILKKKIKEKGVPENIAKRLMDELKEKGSENKGDALRQEAENVFREDLMDELTRRYVEKWLTDEKLVKLEEIKISDKLSDEEYQEMIDKIFGSK